MTDTPIKPCPNCESDKIQSAKGRGVYLIWCNDCHMHGTWVSRPAGKAEVVALWNALPRREDFYTELLEVSEFFDAGWGEEAFEELLEKYKPEGDGE